MYGKLPKLCWLIIALLVLCPQVFAEDTTPAENTDLFDMSLTELMNIEVVVAGTITETNPLKIPASITTITAEDIELTPARNLLDLLEIYVPGAGRIR